MFTNGLVALPLANVLDSFVESNVVGKIIVLFLLVGSIYVWYLMLVKKQEYRTSRLRNAAFLDHYRKNRPPVGIFVSGKKFLGAPLYSVYLSACGELVGRLESAPANAATPESLPPISDRDFDVVRGQAERSVSEEILVLERNMVMLATATSVAPFLGLLGTVLGVMDAFGGMGKMGGAMLSEVAPGISGALLTTVVGLIVALPSVIGYNMLGQSLREIEVQLDSFVEEFAADVSATCRVARGG